MNKKNKFFALLCGLALVGGSTVLAGCPNDDDDDIDSIDDIDCCKVTVQYQSPFPDTESA